jgi:Ni,Fe-hydrogenase I large subunit
VRAVEDALAIKIPENANSIRNIMQLTLQVHDHLVHFYHLHALDWVDVVSALSADPKKTSELAQSISSWPLSSPGYFRDIQNRLKKFVESGQLGPFMNGYWGNPAYKLPPEANLMAVTHYLEALDFQKEIVKIHTIYGGKNPHPNWLVGGVPCAINVHDTGAVGAINMERLNLISYIIDRTIEFIDQVYIPDLLAIASFYKGWTHGGGLSSKSVMSYGDIPDKANDYSAGNLMLPRGAIINGDLTKVHEVDLRDPNQMQEFVDHSWFKYEGDAPGKGLHPWDGETVPHYELGKNAKGSSTNIEQIDEGGKYSWIKAPRWKGHAMEVGPLARYIIGYVQKNPEFKDPVDMVLKKLDLPLTALFSTLGRTAARGLEASWAAHKMRYFQDKLMANLKAGDLSTANIDKWEPSTWPGDQGRRLHRGAARRPGALDTHQGHAHRQLPVRRADHLERQPARLQGPDRRLRGQPDEHPGGQGRSAPGNTAHTAQLRPLPGLLDACHGAGRGGIDQGSGALIVLVMRWCVSDCQLRRHRLTRRIICSQHKTCRKRRHTAVTSVRYMSTKPRCASGTGSTPSPSRSWRSPAGSSPARCPASRARPARTSSWATSASPTSPPAMCC